MTQEPVGNARRALPEIPGNANKHREAAPKAAVAQEAPEPAERVIEGKVVVRKAPWWKRAARSMVADDVTNVGDYLLIDVLVPAAKNLVRDLIFGATERTLYGTTQTRRRSGGDPLGARMSRISTRYDQMSEEPLRRNMSRVGQARHDFEEIVFPDREEAMLCLETMIGRIGQYNRCTVKDLYDFCGISGSFADIGWGWTELMTADVRQVRGGFLLDLPKPEPLER